MTSKKAKSKAEELELDEEFREKYPEFGRIHTAGKNLFLEYLKNGGLIISKYYDDDVDRTIKALDEAFKKDNSIDLDFYDNHAKDFLKDLAQVLSWRTIKKSQEQTRRF